MLRFGRVSIFLKTRYSMRKGQKDMKIGEKIRNAREDADLSQTEVASLIPMNQSNYSKIERDLQEPSLTQLRRICQILNLDPRYLLSLGAYEEFSAKDKLLLSEIKSLIARYAEDTSDTKEKTPERH